MIKMLLISKIFSELSSFTVFFHIKINKKIRFSYDLQLKTSNEKNVVKLKYFPTFQTYCCSAATEIKLNLF